MSNTKMLFKIDASEILAKMHYAGLQNANSATGKGFFVNTGIVNDSESGSPENIGKTRFDLKNDSEMY